MCPNKASAYVKTLFGWYYMCSECLINGHMLTAEKKAISNTITSIPRQCECEHELHN